jgi:hypothetical protein
VRDIKFLEDGTSRVRPAPAVSWCRAGVADALGSARGVGRQEGAVGEGAAPPPTERARAARERAGERAPQSP